MLHDTESYRRLREEVIAATTPVYGAVRFLVVDDSAGTDAEVASLHRFDDVQLLTAPFNLGHQRAIVYGLRHLAPTLADNDVVITMDADGEDQPADVPRLLAALDESGAAVLSGNFAAQRGDSLKATVHHQSFDLCYSSTLLALRRPTTTVPCSRGNRVAGKSRMNRSSLIAHGIRMLLPFSERIAARMLVTAAATFVAVATLLVLTATNVVSGVAGSAGFTLTLAAALTVVSSFIGFLVLLASFPQTSPKN